MGTTLPQVMADGPLPEWIQRQLDGTVELLRWCDDLNDAYRRVQGVFTYGHPPVSAELMDALPRLQVISNHGVGTDHIDIDAARERGIPVGNTPEVLDGAVADLTFALILATARRLPESIGLAKDPATVRFDQSQLHGHDVCGATLGIVGLGRIGREIAQRAQGFSMGVMYHNRHRDADAEAKFGARYCDLPTLMAEADFVVLSVPLTDETCGMIGAAQLRLMKRTSVLINVSRGQVVRTADLTEALQTQRIWAAGLDVTDPEPLPRGHPLLALPNVVITSHIGSATRQTRQKMADLAVDNLLRGLQGQTLTREV